MSKILIIDDDRSVCEILATLLESLGHAPAYALSLQEGLHVLSGDAFDLVFLDVYLPDGNGLRSVSRIKERSSSPEVIIITGEESPEGAQLAVESGAWDYLAKPLTTSQVRLSTSRAIAYREGKKASTTPFVLQRDEIVGSSAILKKCLDQLAKAALSISNVLITGETGTGKELFARAIHSNSSRAGKPFVVVDCAALTEPLVESALFGHVKGSFTGADRDRSGLVKEADKGTLFLDEVGELPMSIQGTFLRVLQERRFRPIGANREIISDFRLIAATNRDLDALAREGRFRSDLLFRLKSIVIHLPVLRDRNSDIVEIALFFMAAFCRRYGKAIKGMSPEFVEALLSYPWPGNVRELNHALESALSAAGEEPILYPIHLPLDLRSRLARDAIAPSSQKGPDPDLHAGGASLPTLRDLLKSVEENYLQALLTQTGGDIKKACDISAVSRANLYARLKKHGISRHF